MDMNELVGRDAVRLHVKWMGVRRRLWLVHDAGLHLEQIRLRVGSVVGDVAKLVYFQHWSGQALRVHQFGAL